jgi:hypothetical protein
MPEQWRSDFRSIGFSDVKCKFARKAMGKVILHP